MQRRAFLGMLPLIPFVPRMKISWLSYNELILENLKRIREIKDSKKLIEEYDSFITKVNFWPRKYQTFAMATFIIHLKGPIYNADSTAKWFKNNKEWLGPKSEGDLYIDEWKKMEMFKNI